MLMGKKTFGITVGKTPFYILESFENSSESDGHTCVFLHTYQLP
jgi:hypothetical protein